jgi:DNA primase
MSSLRETIAGIKGRIDCRHLAQELSLPRRWNSYLCPFHDDHDPSLSISAAGFNCFACGAKGDAIRLFQRVRQVGFREALQQLAARCGVPLPALERRRSRRDAGVVRQQPVPVVAAEPAEARPATDPDRRTAIVTAFADAARLRPDHPPHAPAFSYLQRRGISSTTAVQAGLGFVADYRRATDWLRQRASLAELQAAGLFNERENLKLFKHRLLIPYWCDGEVAMTQARNIDWRNKDRDGAKELTLGRISIPFNADVLLEPQDAVYICEGAIDTLSLLELGFAAVGVPGARNFRPEWCELFDDVREVILALDNDATGHEGAAIIAGHFGRIRREVKRLELPSGIKDINEYLMSKTH